MRIGEVQPFLCQAVDIRREARLGPVAAHVAVTQVVGVNQDDVRPVCREHNGREHQKSENENSRDRPDHEMRLRWGRSSADEGLSQLS